MGDRHAIAHLFELLRWRRRWLLRLRLRLLQREHLLSRPVLLLLLEEHRGCHLIHLLLLRHGERAIHERMLRCSCTEPTRMRLPRRNTLINKREVVRDRCRCQAVFIGKASVVGKALIHHRRRVHVQLLGTGFGVVETCSENDENERRGELFAYRCSPSSMAWRVDAESSISPSVLSSVSSR